MSGMSRRLLIEIIMVMNRLLFENSPKITTLKGKEAEKALSRLTSCTKTHPQKRIPSIVESTKYKDPKGTL